MAKYVIDEKTLTDIADSIRLKKGTTADITPENMPSEIECITGGGSDDVRYVTFMSYDGSIEYGKKAVAVGDDCADPIARGIFSTPIRESTEQYNYTFCGWATEVNGGLDDSALKAVTEDRTVYANFASVVRYYTITYYDSDGKTVLKTESLPYGAEPIYMPPEKEGCIFGGWIPELTTVNGLANYTAQWEEITGFYEAITMAADEFPISKTDFLYTCRFAINNAGTLLAAGLIGRQNDGLYYPPVYDISSGTPVRLTCDSRTLKTYSNVLFSHDDKSLLAYYNRDIRRYTLNDATSFSLDSSSSITTSCSINGIATSPISDLFGYSTNVISGDDYKYTWNQPDGVSFEYKTGTSNPSAAVYSPNGTQFAIGNNYFSQGGLRVYSVNGELLADNSAFSNNYVTNASYNLDGSLIAVSYARAPWVEIYETTNFTKVCDLSDILSAESLAQFSTNNVLVIGTGASVIVRTIEDGTHIPYDKNVPDYSGDTKITGIYRNHNGTRFVIVDHEKVVVWALT